MEPERLSVEVAIVGGGLAGLSAARMLGRQGRSVVVLEARDRLGGRIESCLSRTGLRVDLGAQWSGPGQRRLLALSQELGLTMHATFVRGSKVYELEGRTGRYRGVFPLGQLFAFLGASVAGARLARLGKRVERERAGGEGLALELDALSLGEWVRTRVRLGSAQRLVRFMFQSLLCCDVDQVSLLVAALAVARCGSLEHMLAVQGGAQDRQFSHGAAEFVARLAASVHGTIQLGRVVTSIACDEHHVVICGQHFEAVAKHVIVAIPPQLITRIAFLPELSAKSASLLAAVRMGSVVKFQVIYDRPFWREQALSGESWSIGGLVGGTYDTSSPNSPLGVLTVLAAAEGAEQLRRLPAAERRTAVLTALARQFGGAASTPLDLVERIWADEQWSGGGYTVSLPPGAFLNGFEPLRSEHRRLHFAGTEHAYAWPGYMEGALESAERVTAEVLGALKDEKS